MLIEELAELKEKKKTKTKKEILFIAALLLQIKQIINTVRVFIPIVEGQYRA